MKIKGLSKATFQTALHSVHSVHPKLAFKDTPVPGSRSAKYDHPGTIEGYPYYSHTPKKPCVHDIYAIIKACLVAGATDVWAEKLHFTSQTGFAHYQKLYEKLTQGTAKKPGLMCTCVSVLWAKSEPPKVEPSEQVEPEPEPVVEPVVVTATLTMPPLQGEPLTTGERTTLPKGQRSVMAAVTGLYVLIELDMALDAIAPMKPVAHQVQCKCGARDCPHEVEHGGPATNLGGPIIHTVMRRVFKREDAENYNIGDRVFVEEFLSYKDRYLRTLARNMFDYLTIASTTEFRYAYGVSGWSDKKKPCDRGDAQLASLAYDPRTLLPVLEHGFKTFKWSGSFGGKKWAAICRAASYYFKFPDLPIVFIDHCVDLSHNGGLAFNKGYIMANPQSKSDYLTMLDTKRNGSLLQSQLPLQLPTEIYNYVNTFTRERILDRQILRRCSIAADPDVPAMKWGSKPFHLNMGKVVPETAPEATKASTMTTAIHPVVTLTPERKQG